MSWPPIILIKGRYKMAKIMRMTDRITLKIDDITVKLAPLTIAQKCEIVQLVESGQVLLASNKALRYSLKEVEGLEGYDDTPYQLEFIEDGNLSEVCAQEISNIKVGEKLLLACIQLFSAGGCNELIDPTTGEPMEGVEILKVGK